MNTLRIKIIPWLFLLIALVCLVCLFLPTKLDIKAGVAPSPYVIQVKTLLTHNAVLVRPVFDGDDDIFSFTVTDFDVQAIIHYPKYYIGLVTSLLVACAGLIVSSVLGVKNG